MSCGKNYKTIETYAQKKRGNAPGAKVHPNSVKLGSSNHLAVLTEDNVREIRRLAENKTTYASISASFGIHVSTVYRIVNRHLWAHI